MNRLQRVIKKLTLLLAMFSLSYGVVSAQLPGDFETPNCNEPWITESLTLASNSSNTFYFEGDPQQFLDIIDINLIQDQTLLQRYVQHQNDVKNNKSPKSKVKARVDEINAKQDSIIIDWYKDVFETLATGYAMTDKNGNDILDKNGKVVLNDAGRKLLNYIKLKYLSNPPQIHAPSWANTVADQETLNLAIEIFNELNKNPNFEGEVRFKYRTPDDLSYYMNPQIDLINVWRTKASSILIGVLDEIAYNYNHAYGVTESGELMRDAFDVSIADYVAMPDIELPQLNLKDPEEHELVFKLGNKVVH
ncbi:MAG TPA: hypothetical protein DCW42_08425 [Bacteroidetes bacterium]|nr:hypothetical protein [Bacteroidota bacterium]